MTNKAIFLDRDGTINKDLSYVYKIEELEIIEGTKEGLTMLKEMGYKLIIITNQSGIGRGYYTQIDCDNFNKELESRLGIKFDDIYICPHSPEDNCECRKPKTKNIKQAIQKFDIDITKSYFVGDKDADIQSGINIGCKTVLIDNGQYKCQIQADYKVKSITEFAKLITEDNQ